MLVNGLEGRSACEEYAMLSHESKTLILVIVAPEQVS